MENEKATPSFYEIAAKIVTFCNEMDIMLKTQKVEGDKNDYDKRGLEI